MEKLKSLRPILLFHLLLNVSVILFITGASYYHTPLEGFKDTSIYVIHLLILQTTVAGILYFLSLNRWLFKIIFSGLFLLYCGFSFWAYSQDISITLPLIQSVLETKPDIAIDVITLPYTMFFLAAIGTLYFIIKRHQKIQATKGFKTLVLPAVACILLFYVLEQKRPGSLKNRLPYNLIAGLAEYFEKPALQLKTNIPNLEFNNDPLKLVFVLGETVRADHIGLNGYDRNTTPLLSSEKNLISYTSLYTNNTYTGASVPQILTDQNLESDEGTFTSIYSVANKANFETTWIGNQTLEKSFSPIVNTNNKIILVDKYKSVFSFGKELDEIMLVSLDTLLPKSERQFITIQMIGSHWWYENRYTEKQRKFTPVIDSKYIPSLTKEQIVNSYDNTIIYLDFFLV
jgi:Predicted membrane-associated, metal-dependent hydrolase